MSTAPARRTIGPASDAPSARHVTHTEHGSDRKHRWHCECGRSGRKSYEHKTVAAEAGWTHERELNGQP